ncbi:MAG: aldo/keto reductase [Proteobacteria bacterium]|nr:aldo/keto reductase [Pseudomonadota bacterium]
MKKHETDPARKSISRRGFLKASGTAAALAGGTLAGCGGAQPPAPVTEAPDTTAAEEPPDAPDSVADGAKPKVTRFRTLGRTGFEVSDVSLGCGHIAEANVVRYAYDHGINLFDVAEGYGEGDSERKIGEVMAHMDRKKIFIVTKLEIKPNDNEQTILDRFGKCQERLKTEYVDALYMHSVRDPALVTNEGFHSATQKLKAEGRLKHAGISCHGPDKEEEASMEAVLLKAVEDGRFDVMLLTYNYMKAEEGERVLKACKEKNIGTTAMKTSAGRLQLTPFDPSNPGRFQGWIDYLMKEEKKTREQAVEAIFEQRKIWQAEMDKNRPKLGAFKDKYGVKTQQEIDLASVQWVLGNPDMHTICVSMPSFDSLDLYLPLSGTELSARQTRLLRDFALAHSHQYCRHGCTECASFCSHGVPVCTIMRYTYYFNHQQREKHALKKYASLKGRNASPCMGCDAPCRGKCPHGVPIQASLVSAHHLLTLG